MERLRPHQTSARQLLKQAALSAIGSYVSPASWAMALLYLGYAWWDYRFIPFPQGRILAVIAAVSGLVTFLIGVIVPKARGAERHMHAVAGVLALIVLLNSALALGVLRDPLHSVNFLLLLFAVGSLFTSWTWFAILVGLSWLSFGAIAWTTGSPMPWTQNAMAFLGTTVMSTLIFAGRTSSRARAALSDERFRRLADATSEAIVIHEQGRIQDVNMAFTRVFGFRVEEVIGKPVSAFILPNPGTSEGLGVGSRGRAFPIEVRVRKLSVGTRGGLEIIAVSDLSERKHAGQLIADQQELLFQADKLSALGEMAAGIAHEIRNPLTSILLQADFLKKRPEAIKDPAIVAKCVERIAGDANRINRIIHGMRVMSRNSSADLPEEDCSVRSVLQDSLELCRERSIRQGVRMIADPLAEDILFRGNPTQILQVLINLVTNAQDAVEGGSDRWVRLSASYEPSRGAAPVEISVIDSGPGVPLEVKEKIMQPFFTTKAAGKGTGLGLSISKKIIENHGGSLVLDESGPHTRFVVRLPGKPAGTAPEALRAAEAASDPPQAARRR